MTSHRRFTLCSLAFTVAASFSASTPGTAQDIKSTPVTRIWDGTRVQDREKTRMELTDLIRFRGQWYCSFREGEVHNNHPSGRGRIIRSADGEKWETAVLLTWDGADVREPKLCISAEGHLMAGTSIYFVSKEPRKNGAFYQLNKPIGAPHDDAEAGVVRQSVTWFSTDGTTWSSAYACPTGINTWRWEITWHNGMGYSVAHPGLGGKDKGGVLYRTRDGKSWRPLKEAFFSEMAGNEASLNFAPDNTGICLLRSGATSVMLGIGQPPSYQEWKWQDVQVDWLHDGTLRPAKQVIRGSLGGPKLLRLRDGRLLAVGRALGPGREDGRATLFWVDAEKSTLTRFAEVDGTSYSGVIEYEGNLWVTCCDTAASAIFLAKVPIPAPAGR